ncbi:MAG: alanine racemase, partial [Janthinobacterium lividum]
MKSANCTLEIDLSKIQQNYKILQSICLPAEIGAAIKANAYGLGAARVVPSLYEAGCRNFFVANIDEGFEARSKLAPGKDINIYVLNGVFTDDLAMFESENLVPVLNHLEQVNIWQQFTQFKKKILPCVIHINTGINRLGMGDDEIRKLVCNSSLIDNLEIKYVMSHLSASEDYNNSYNEFQLNRFSNYLKYFPKAKASLSNSSGIFLGSKYHFDLVRPGLALYGGNPTPGQQNPMQNVIKLSAPIIQVQKLKAG